MGTAGRVSKQKRLNVLIAVLVAVIAVLLITILNTQRGSTSRQARQAGEAEPTAAAKTSQPGPLDKLPRRQPGAPMALGKPDAPVVLVAYEDFRCPFCAKFATETAPKLRERYVDTGKLRIEWRDFPIFGEQSKLAAKAGRAAARQGKFWEFHDVVFADAPGHGHPTMTMSKLADYAKQAGVTDIAKFKADMEDPAVAQAIRKDFVEGSRLGVTSTPTFVINGRPVVGAQPLPVFVKTIEQALAQAK